MTFFSTGFCCAAAGCGSTAGTTVALQANTVASVAICRIVLGFIVLSLPLLCGISYRTKEPSHWLEHAARSSPWIVRAFDVVGSFTPTLPDAGIQAVSARASPG